MFCPFSGPVSECVARFKMNTDIVFNKNPFSDVPALYGSTLYFLICAFKKGQTTLATYFQRIPDVALLLLILSSLNGTICAWWFRLHNTQRIMEVKKKILLSVHSISAQFSAEAAQSRKSKTLSPISSHVNLMFLSTSFV